MSLIDLPDIPSWIWVVLIGFGMVYLLQESIGWKVMAAGLGLGALYFGFDIINKFQSLT